MTSDITCQNGKRLRNTLIHYVPHPQAVPQLSLGKPLCGLVEVHFSKRDYAGMSQAIDEHVRRVAQALDDWSNQP